MNNTLSNIEIIKLKIKTVEVDVQKLQAEGGNIRKVEALTEYKAYLQDELKTLEHDN